MGGWSSYPYGWKDTTKKGTYDPRIISVHDGMMDIFVRYQDGEFKVAAPMPNIGGNADIRNQLYGRYEFRFYIPTPAPGYKVAWLLWPKSEVWPRDGEIDFPDQDLKTGSPICAYMHRQNGTSGGDQDVYCTNVALVGQWHTGVMEWEPNSFKFFLNGALIGHSTSRVPNTPMRWVLQTETNLSSTLPSTSESAHVYVDYVRVWKYAP